MPTHNQPDQDPGRGHDPEKHEVDAAAGFEAVAATSADDAATRKLLITMPRMRR